MLTVDKISDVLVIIIYSNIVSLSLSSQSVKVISNYDQVCTATTQAEEGGYGFILCS